MNGVQENLFGNYIIQKGLANPSLRDEIMAQVANQVRPEPRGVEMKAQNETESLHMISLLSASGVEES